MSALTPLRTLDVAGTTFAYVRAGRGSPVALVHGNLASHRYWQELLAGPPAGTELIAMDLPNFGASGPLPEPLSIRAYGEALASFLRALELPPVTLVGHSLGGAVAPADYHGPEASIRGFEVLAAEPSAAARRAMIARRCRASCPRAARPTSRSCWTRPARSPRRP
ncbi:MAG: alpha/beta fold hydrolase [Deinococcales bacterium]